MLRLALVHGCQDAAAQYAAAVRRVRDVAFTAVVQSQERDRQQAALSLNLSVTAGSLGRLLESNHSDFDAVLIRGPVTQRDELTCQAAAAGKHVFLTSPAAVSEQDLDRMASVCQSAGVTLAVGSRRRYEPSILAVKSAVDSGKLGAAALLRIHQWLPRDSGRPADQTRATHRRAGRVWSEVVTHLDLAHWLFGRAPTEIFVQGGLCGELDQHWPEYLQLHLGFSDGGMALISLTCHLPAGDHYGMLSMIGSTGAAYADAHHQQQLQFRGEAPRALQSNDDIPTKAAQLRDFARALNDPAHAAATVHDMKTALRLADWAWTSLVWGKPVFLDGAQHAAHQ